MIDPGFERGDLLSGERGEAEGHLRFAAGAFDALDDAAGGGVAGGDGAHGEGARVEPETPGRAVAGVAWVAGGLEDGQDLGGEFGLRGGFRGGGGLRR